MIETIEFNGVKYPKFQSEGNAARWIIPFAQHYCKGSGYDIGYCKEEWKLPGAIGIDEAITAPFNAMNLPSDNMDFIFNSHCLEHVKENWYNVLDYWLSKLKVGGLLFMYLPHKSQEYWLPKNNRKHIHSFDGSEISEYLESLGHDVFCSGVDLNNAFVVVCEKNSSVSINQDKITCESNALKAAYSNFTYDIDLTPKEPYSDIDIAKLSGDERKRKVVFWIKHNRDILNITNEGLRRIEVADASGMWCGLNYIGSFGVSNGVYLYRTINVAGNSVVLWGEGMCL